MDRLRGAPLWSSRLSLVFLTFPVRQMTGLDRTSDTIMSIACYVTSANLELLDDGFEVVVSHSREQLDAMGEWCQRTHGASGLMAACLSSTITPGEAADALLAYIKHHIPEPRQGLLAGNSVHADKEFLSKAPYNRVIGHLHYRILDVSSIKEAAKRWAPSEMLSKAPKKKGLHQAKEDILESIEEAKFYRDVFFGSSEGRRLSG